MKRLTEKFYHNGFEYMATALGGNNPYAIDKLGKLEDLEEEIGCPLEVVGKAITYGIAYELKNGLIESEPHISLTECGYGYILCSGSSKRKIVENGEFQTKDYKKTWWLKESKEE